MLRAHCPDSRSLFLGGLIALAIGLVGASPASASSCNLVAVDPGGTVTGPSSLTFATRAPAVIKFNCSGTTQPPALQATGTGNLSFYIGPAVRAGSLWAFTLTRQNGLAESGQLLFKDEDVPGSPTQLIDVTVLASSGDGPGPGIPRTCEDIASTAMVPVILGSLEFRRPGSKSFSAVPSTALCAIMGLPVDVSSDGSGRTGVRFNIEPPFRLPDDPWPYPEGTVFRMSGEVPGFRPASVFGRARNVRFELQGQRFVLEGEVTTTQSFDTSLGESGCASAQTNTGISGNLVGDWIGEKLAGSALGANGYTQSTPEIDADGRLTFSIAGCGDGKPDTREGFYDAQFGKAFLDSGGVTQAVLATADDAAVAELFSVTNNGKESTASFAKAEGQDGEIVVLMNYRTSFSAHTIKVRADRKAAAFARGCAKKKGSKLRRTRVKARNPKTKKKTTTTYLTCTPRKGKSTRLKVG